MNIRAIVLFTACMFLGACTTPPSPPSSPSSSPSTLNDSERDAFVLLLLGPKPNSVKNCAVLALRLGTGLTLMRMGKSSDDQVAEKLKSGIPAKSASLLAVREQQIAAWRESHDPAQLALMDFEFCQSANGVKSPLGALGKTCFSLANVPAMAEAIKTIGLSKERAQSDVLAGYRTQLPEDFLNRVVQDVYANDAKASDYEAHRRVLASCIRDTR